MKQANTTRPRDLIRSLGWVRWCGVTVFGIGHLQPASGTWGSLPPVFLAATLAWCGVSHAVWIACMVAVALVAGAVCLAWGDAAERAAKEKDPSQVVIDEVAGQAAALVLAWTPSLAEGGVGSLHHGLIASSGSFLLFRAFDILKPFPIGRLQKLHAGAGIALDDLAAGVAAGITLMLLRVMGFP